MVKVFEFPSRPFNAIIIPSKEDLQDFHQWLKEPLARALFLIYSTTGLRRKEAVNLNRDIDFEKGMIILKGIPSRTKGAELPLTMMKLKRL